MEAIERPLTGLSLVEAYAPDAPLALRLAGALAGRMAADLGAGVVKLDPGADDPVRRIAPFVGGVATTFAFLNAGKTVLTGRDGESGRAALAAADIAIVDDGLFATSRDWPAITAVLSLFRSGAPPTPASEFTVLALGGMLHMIGEPDREPLRLGGRQAAYAAGLAAYAGIAAALCRPKRDGKLQPERVHVSLLDTAIWLNWKSVPSPDQSKAALVRAGALAEWQVLRCADGWIALVYQEPDWPGLCDLVDDDRLRAPRFATRAERLQRPRDIAAIVEERFVSLTRRQIHEAALARRLPIGPVWAPGDLRTDPQYLARGFLCETQIAGTGVAMPTLPVIWGGQRFAPGPVPVSVPA